VAEPLDPPALDPHDLVLEPGDVWAYLAGRGLVTGTGTVREVGDGNMNRVFLALPDDGGRSVAVKQAPPWIRALGPSAPMSPERAMIEVRALATFARFAPEQTPAVLDVDPERFAFTMEDLSDLVVLRGALTAGAPFGDTSAQVGGLIGRVTFATSVAGASAADRAALMAASVNPVLAAVTEQYLLSEPFLAHEHNSNHPALAAEVAALRADPAVRTEVSSLRAAFATKAEALVHGDLHSGSVMVGERDGAAVVRVIDPEFAVVGPIGLDLGLYLANALIATARAATLGDAGRTAEHATQPEVLWTAFTAAWHAGWPERVDRFLDDGWLRRHLARVWDDTLGFAGVEMVRRVAGYSHAEDLETLPDPGPASAVVLRAARTLLVDRARLHGPGGEPDPAAVAALVDGRGTMGA
jgi:5-methylthioribose kinase